MLINRTWREKTPLHHIIDAEVSFFEEDLGEGKTCSAGLVREKRALQQVFAMCDHHSFESAADLQFFQDVLYVIADGVEGEHQFIGNVFGCVSGCQ